MFYLQVFCQWIIKNNTLTWIQLSIIPSCTLIFLLFTRCNLLLSVFSVSLRVLSNIFSFFLYYHHPLIIYTFAVIHSVLSSHIHTETHTKILKTSCFNILVLMCLSHNTLWSVPSLQLWSYYGFGLLCFCCCFLQNNYITPMHGRICFF